MSKIAFLFPGQGAQYVGMGKDFYEAFPVCREVFEEASKASGLDIPALCFEENDKLNQTEYTQICMLAVEAAILKAVETQGIQSDVNAGLSLGEYGAVIASGVMSLEDAFRVVRQRGIYMQEAVPAGGAMTAVLGLDAKIIEKACEEVEGIVSVANYNCPGQLVIGGEKAAVEQAAALAKEAGARRCIPLKVSGPFHTKLMAPAGDALAQRFAGETFGTMETPVLFNCLGHEKAETDSIPQLLVKQVQSSVYMEDTLRRLGELGVDHILEVGPGSALSGFVKKTLPGVVCTAVETPEQLDAVLTAWKEAE